MNNLIAPNLIPTVQRKRSKMFINDRHRSTFNLGELRCLNIREVVPGDTFKSSDNFVLRMPPLVAAPMDNLELDIRHFYVRKADLWDHYAKFIGESTSKWRDQVMDLVQPKIVAPSGGWTDHTLADDFGLPYGIDGLKTNSMFFRAYAKCVNDWYRSTVTEDELYIPTGDSDQSGVDNTATDEVNDIANGMLYVVNRNVDLFSASSIEPQRGPGVNISISDDTIPVFGNGKALAFTDGNTFVGESLNSSGDYSKYTGSFGADVGDSLGATTKLANGKVIGVPTKDELLGLTGATLADSGLVAGLNNVGVISINELRNAFAIQRYYEGLSIFGNRYDEIIRFIWGVNVPDATLHKAEYLGGASYPVQFFNNVQSSETGSSSPQGNMVSYSVTQELNHYSYEKSFTEPGFVLTLACVRVMQHSYCQGILKQHLRDTFYDEYNPLLDSLGDAPIYNAEIYAQGPSVVDSDGNEIDKQVFGYNERFADYRHGTNITSGYFKPTHTTPLDMYLFTDKYTSLPHLERAWMKEDYTVLDRCLAITSANVDQFWMDYREEFEAIRPMSLHSLPGAIIR